MKTNPMIISVLFFGNKPDWKWVLAMQMDLKGMMNTTKISAA